MVAVMAAAFAACSGDARQRGAADGPLEVRIGTFLAKGGVRGLVQILSAEPLVSVGWDGRPVFRLAESAAYSDEGRTLALHLRPKVKLHTGEALTAAIVRDLLAPQMLKRAEDVSSVAARDDRTIVFTLKRPYALRPIDFGAFNVDDDARPAVKTGPFKIVSLEPAPVLERFTGYYLGVPLIERVEITQYPTHRAAWTAMLRGDVNFLHEVSRDAIDFLEAGGDIQAYRLLRPYTVPLVFNLRHPVLRRTDVRVAISEAIDRSEVVANGMRGHGEVAEGPFWPFHWAYSRGRYASPYNPEAAAVRLDAAGLPASKRHPDQTVSRFRFTCLLPAGDTRFERIALVAQRQLYAVGIDMELRPLPQAEFISRITRGDFEAFIFEMLMGRTLEYPYRFWHSKGAQALSGYAAADAALDRMTRAQNDDDIRMAVADVMRILRADPPAVFMAIPREARAAEKRFLIPYEADQDVFGAFWQMTRRPTETAPGQ